MMRFGGSREMAEAVRDRALEAGLQADVLEGMGGTVVDVGGRAVPGLQEQLESMPGVLNVAGGELAPRKTGNLRVEDIRPLVPPAILLEELPLSGTASQTVSRAREEVKHVLDGLDDRLVVVVGPCSVHDPAAALEYASRLRSLAKGLEDDLCVVMRVYFEKPRTTVGWKGLINDPYLDGSFAVNDGLRSARGLLLELAELGVPAGCEFLDPISPQFFADAVSWGAIGARTTESQVHRQLASGLSMPIGFKNGTDGGVQVAIDAVRASASPHRFLGVTEQGLAAIVATRGNPDCHLILRGGKDNTNYDARSVGEALSLLRGAGVPPRVMVDASHGNSSKDYRRQPLVTGEVADGVARGESGVVGVMLESFLVEGSQDTADASSLVYGQSITDSCVGWETTEEVLRELARAARARRKLRIL